MESLRLSCFSQRLGSGCLTPLHTPFLLLLDCHSMCPITSSRSFQDRAACRLLSKNHSTIPIVYHMSSPKLCHYVLMIKWINLVFESRSVFESCLDHSLALEMVKQGGHIIYHLSWNTFESESHRDNRHKPGLAQSVGTCLPLIIHPKGQQPSKIDCVERMSWSGVV